MKALLLFTAAILALSASARADEDPPATVDYVDIDSYVGLWYEIAKVPNRFQDQCAGGTTARYTIRKDGRIDVVNRCLLENGETDEADGIAKIADTKTNAKLKVSFVRFLGISFFWGDYWIIGLGENYEYAVVGSPDRKYGWILSRTPTLDDATLDEVFSILRNKGYDPADFEMTPQ